MDSQFDVLAKTIALAGGMPRREAVRRVGGALALAGLSWLGAGCGGGSGSGSSPLSPLPPGTSGTGRAPQGGGNSDCAHFCQKAFPPGPQRGKCVSDAANGTGLCVQCNGDISRLCSGACVDLQTDVNNCGGCGNACASGQSCTNGACIRACIPDFMRGCISAADCCSFSTGVACCLQGLCGHGQPFCAV